MSAKLHSMVLIIAIALASTGSVADKPQRIVSLSLCTDQLLLMLVDKSRIAALSHLASDPIYSYMWQASRNINVHHNLAEEIVPLNPDLIIGSSFTSGNIVQMLNRLGHDITTFTTPETLQQVEQLTLAVGKAVHEPERARMIIHRMREDIARAKQLVANKPSLLAISYGPNGYTAGKRTLKNAILEAAGYRNVATQLGIEYYGNVPLEQLVLANPDIIIPDEDIPNQDSLAQNLVNHPVLARLLQGKAKPSLPTSYWICPGPIAGKAILALAEQRQ